MGKDDQLAYAYSILDRAVSLHKPKYAVAFFSGGYDSLVTTPGFCSKKLHTHIDIDTPMC